MRVIDWARACCPNRNIKNKIPAEPVSGPRANSCDDDSMPVICPTGKLKKLGDAFESATYSSP
jgi:hypothetical protein